MTDEPRRGRGVAGEDAPARGGAEAGDGAMNAHAELSDARAELIAVVVEWHAGELPDQRLHEAAERYQTLRDAYLDSLWSRT